MVQRKKFGAIWCVFWLLAGVLCQAQQLVTQSPRATRVCLNGSYNVEGRCVCNPGYAEIDGTCFQLSSPIGVETRCPSGTVLWNGFCHYQTLPPIQDVVPPQEKLVVVPPLHIDIPIPELIDPLDPNNVDEEEDNEPEVITPQVEDHQLNLSFERVVSNHNVINNATTIHTHNVNNVVVHIARRKPNGAIRTIIIRNNETTVYDEDEQDKNRTESSSSLPPTITTECSTEADLEVESVTTEMPNREIPCCSIVSPRVCRKQKDEWVCFHRKQYVCHSVCTADVMYLRPRKPIYRKPWLVLPPRPNPFARFKRCRWGRCPRLDCSGCISGYIPFCHPMCYTYDCMLDNSCHFLDRDLTCPDPANELCMLLEEKTINLLKPAAEEEKTMEE